MHPAYIAGILDGEGYLAVRRDVKGYLCPVIEIAHSSRDLLELFALQFGGRVMSLRSKYWKISFYGQRAVPILEASLSYLVLKRGIAELLLEFLRENSPGKANKCSPQQQVRRQEIYELTLNQSNKGHKRIPENAWQEKQALQDL